MSFFLGPWSATEARTAFEYNDYVIIDNFFAKDVAETMAKEFPDPIEGETKENERWHVYDNPLEKKYARDDVETFPHALKEAFEYLESGEWIETLRDITGIHSLVTDPHRHGAGIHAHGRGDKLDMHVDYSVHPITGATRSVNLLLYLTPDWDDSWGGHVVVKDLEIAPAFNRAVIFRTDGLEETWHGLPEPLRCPRGIFRKSLAIYYVRHDGPPLHGKIRPKACFAPMEGPQGRLAKQRPEYAKLYQIRSQRRLEPGDMWPGWDTDPDGEGLWW